MINRMLTLPISTERKNNEWQNILTIAKNNKYPIHTITKLKTKIQQDLQKPKTKEEKNNKKWATFTYHSPKVRTITNLFKDTNIRIAYKTTNTIKQRTKTRNPNTTPDLNRSGVYKMTCKTCSKAYIGQTSRDLTVRCREHLRYIKNNDPQSAYAQHILHNIHEYGTPAETITLLKPISDKNKLIPYEQLFIQAYHENGNLVQEQSGNEGNPLFQLIIDRMATQ